MLGKAKKVMIDKENTTIVNGAGKKKRVGQSGSRIYGRQASVADMLPRFFPQ
jgi:hypothetical protein